jgi:Ca2+-binding RTX toxin-like protein
VTVSFTNTRKTVDLKITKSCPSSSPGSFQCTLTVTNQGNSPATNVVVTDDLSPGLTAGPVASSDPSFTCTDPPGSVDIRCTSPTLAGGASATFTYSVSVGETASPGQSFTNNASVSSSSQDTIPGNNQASVTLKVPACQKTGTNLTGTSGNDTLCGTAGDDNITGGGGNDLIFLFGGNDRATGGDGNDTILGGGGADDLTGGNGNDSLFGNDGNDRLTGGAGNDLGVGGPGADTCLSTESGVC